MLVYVFLVCIVVGVVVLVSASPSSSSRLSGSTEAFFGKLGCGFLLLAVGFMGLEGVKPQSGVFIFGFISMIAAGTCLFRACVRL